MVPRLSFADVLPATMSAARSANALWSEDFAVTNARQGLTAARVAFSLELPTALEAGTTAVLDLAQAVRTDLLSDPSTVLGEADSRDLDLVMIDICGIAATAALQASRPGEAYDWLVHSLTNTWEVEGDLDFFMDRGRNALSSPAFAGDATDVVALWLEALFSYDAAVGGLRSTASRQAELAFRLLDTAGPKSLADQLGLAGAVLGWASRLTPDARSSNPGLGAATRRVGTALARLCDEHKLAREDEAIARAILALTAAEVTGQVQKVHRQALLALPTSDVRLVDKLDASIAMYEGQVDKLEADLEPLLDLVSNYSLGIATSDETATRQLRTTHLSHIAPAVHTLLNAGRVQSAVRVLSMWHHPNSSSNALPGDAVLACFRHAGGTTWALENVVGGAPPSCPDSDADAAQAEFTTSVNAFLGTSLIAPSSPVPLEAPQGTRGVPDPSMSPRFEKATVAYCGFDAIPLSATDGAASHSALRSMLVLPSLMAPIQSLMLKHVGWTLPLTMTLQNPLPDRPVRRALVWLYGSMFNQRELDALVPRLQAQGVEVDVRESADQTRERFLRDYQSPDYDLIWVGCHGEVPPFDATQARLEVAADGGVGLSDLRAPASDKGRRILVLNACDSASAYHYGGIGDLSMAGAAAGASQAVIAHLWPIGTTVAAPVFAASLAESLSKHSFFGAYCATVQQLQQGSEVVNDALTLPPALAREVTDHPDLLDNLAGWGSATFVE